MPSFWCNGFVFLTLLRTKPTENRLIHSCCALAFPRFPLSFVVCDRICRSGELNNTDF